MIPINRYMMNNEYSINLDSFDFNDKGMAILRMQFSETYAHKLIMYCDARMRKRIKWTFFGAVKNDWFVKMSGFSIEHINFETKELTVEVHNKLELYIKNYSDKVIILNTKLSNGT